MARSVRSCITLVMLIAALLAASDAPAQKVYRWVDADGQVQFTQSPPPDSADFQIREFANPEISEERRRYCEAIRNVAQELARMAARGVPITVASESARQFEIRENIDVDQVALRELVNYVYSATRSGRYSATVSGNAHNACITGSFGRLGRTSTARHGSEPPRSDGAGRGHRGSVSGTGWVSGGMVVTNYHVIDGSSNLRVRLPDGGERSAHVAHSDPENDIAVLAVVGSLPPGLPIASRAAELGAEVFTLGYPHTNIMGSNAKLTAGIINSTTGIQDDPRLYQISVTVQAGNSGGPLITLDGEVVGVVTAKLRADEVYRATGDVPQNVNYAVKAEFVRRLLRSSNGGQSDHPVEPGSLQQLAARFGPAIVVVIGD